MAITIDDEETVVITNTILQASDTDSTDCDLMYNIVAEPLNGGVYNNQTGLRISSFTQGDIDNGYIEYRHTGDVGDNSFVYTVTDGTNTTTNQTFSISVNTVHVTVIELDSESETWNINVTDTIGYTINPINATNQGVSWSSNNDIVATVDSVTGMITAHSVGVATVIVTADDTTNGTITDTCIITVSDSKPENPSGQKGKVTGTLVDHNGLPLSGYIITLYSNPITVTTDSSGRFKFSNVPYNSHTLVVSMPDNTEIGRFALSFNRNSANSSSIDNASNTVNILHSDYTTSINLNLQTNMLNTDINIINIGFIEIVTNPATGYYVD